MQVVRGYKRTLKNVNIMYYAINKAVNSTQFHCTIKQGFSMKINSELLMTLVE